MVSKVQVTLGVALGKIAAAQPPLTGREACEGGSRVWGVGASLFLVVFGKAGNGSGWGKKQFLHVGSLQPHFWVCLALPFLGASALSGESVLPMGQCSLRGRPGQPSTFAYQYG